jgi:hypothetical protein
MSRIKRQANIACMPIITARIAATTGSALGQTCLIAPKVKPPARAEKKVMRSAVVCGRGL